MFVKKVKQRLEVLPPPPTLGLLFIPMFQWYRHAHAKDMPLRAIARLIQTMLYAQRFFPYYVYNILGGIEEDGKLILLAPAKHALTPAFLNMQVQAPFIPLIPWDPMNARHVVPRERHSPSYNLSSITR